MVRRPREQRVGWSEKGIWAIHVPFTRRRRRRRPSGGDGTDGNDDGDEGTDDDGDDRTADGGGGDAIPKDHSRFASRPLSYLHGGAPMKIPTN